MYFNKNNYVGVMEGKQVWEYFKKRQPEKIIFLFY